MRLALVVCFLILSLFISVSHSVEPVVIEFLFYEPCPVCPPSKLYLHNNQVVEAIQTEYGSKVLVKRIDFFSLEGQEKVEQYGIELGGQNTIVLNYEKVIGGYANETYVREVVDAYLYELVHDVSVIKVLPSHSVIVVGEKINITVTLKNPGIESESFEVNVYCNESLIGTQTVTSLSPKHELSIIYTWDTTNQTLGSYTIKAEAEPVANETNLVNNIYIYSEIEVTSSHFAALTTMLMLAFTLGFFETFSPCLIILLSFVLSYTISKTSPFKESFSRVMIFGMGFLSATILLAVVLGLVFLSMPVLQYSLTWIVCVFALVFGLNLLGVLKIPFTDRFQSKPVIKKLARKFVITYAGLFLLGFIFYFLDPCIAPIFVSIMPLLLPETFLFTLFVFCIGAIVPFIGIGVFAGSISKLARSTYKHRSEIRAISGLILIGYALYLIVFYLLHIIK